MKRSTKRKIELILVLAFSILAFRKEVRSAYLWRGYHAFGGEYLMLLFPVIYYLLRPTALAYWGAFRRFMFDEKQQHLIQKHIHIARQKKSVLVIHNVPKPKWALRKVNGAYQRIAN